MSVWGGGSLDMTVGLNVFSQAIWHIWSAYLQSQSHKARWRFATIYGCHRVHLLHQIHVLMFPKILIYSHRDRGML